jgi:hypothetical protein
VRHMSFFDNIGAGGCTGCSAGGRDAEDQRESGGDKVEGRDDTGIPFR